MKKINAWNACKPILVGVASPVLEIVLLSKTVKFPFQPMDYSPRSSKNLRSESAQKIYAS